MTYTEKTQARHLLENQYGWAVKQEDMSFLALLYFFALQYLEVIFGLI